MLEKHLEPDFAKKDYDAGAKAFFEAVYEKVVDDFNLNLSIADARADYNAFIREYEAENDRVLDMESDDDIELLYSMIMQEHPADNEKTKADLAKNGQQVDGVITSDGIIVDGNRRATLLRALFNGDADKYGQSVEDFRYFNAIVLPGDIDGKEIMALETMLQIGADKPVGYNRICLYIKVDNLLNAGYTYPQIKQYMGLKSDKDVEEMQSIF